MSPVGAVIGWGWARQRGHKPPLTRQPPAGSRRAAVSQSELAAEDLPGLFAAASGITAVLSMDATIVLLTPVVLATAAGLGPGLGRMSMPALALPNTAPVLLPVSNLTNLLAFAASGLGFTRFAALTALPWLAAVGAEYVVFRSLPLTPGAHRAA